jgi:hypothetical protein
MKKKMKKEERKKRKKMTRRGINMGFFRCSGEEGGLKSKEGHQGNVTS